MNHLKALVKLVTTRQVGYNPHDKDRFHRLADECLKQIADDLGMGPGDYKIETIQGGIGVSGDVVLVSDRIYIKFSQSVVDNQFLFRSGNSGRNQWLSWKTLSDNYGEALIRFRAAKDVHKYL